MASAKDDQASLVAHLRASGRHEFADTLASLRPGEVRAYLRDFAKRHASQLETPNVAS